MYKLRFAIVESFVSATDRNKLIFTILPITVLKMSHHTIMEENTKLREENRKLQERIQVLESQYPCVITGCRFEIAMSRSGNLIRVCQYCKVRPDDS